MTWTSFHRRGDVLRAVIAEADRRRDGRLPVDVEGVAETFADDLELLGALALKWHTRLAGRIEREQMHQPMELRAAVVRAWQTTADELPGIRAVLDHHRAEPADERMAETLRKASAKERLLLAVMAGEGSAQDPRSIAAGARIEAEARATWLPTGSGPEASRPGFLGRLKAALAA